MRKKTRQRYTIPPISLKELPDASEVRALQSVRTCGQDIKHLKRRDEEAEVGVFGLEVMIYLLCSETIGVTDPEAAAGKRS